MKIMFLFNRSVFILKTAKSLFLLLFCLLLLPFLLKTNVFAQQNNRVKKVISLADEFNINANSIIKTDLGKIYETIQSGYWVSESIDLPFENPNPFTAFSIVLDDIRGDFSAEYSYCTTENGINWSDWQLIKVEEHAEILKNRKVLELLFLESSVKQIKIRKSLSFSTNISLENIELNFFNPEGGKNIEVQNVENQSIADVCPCPAPSFVKRSNWCSTCPASSSPTYTTVTHLIVHHAAGANTSTNWGAVVAAIWDYHVNTNLWADIGYNWLISPEGKMYEGRGENVQGAHFCGTNGNTMGVCMLGNLDTAQPTNLALDKLKSILSYKSCKDNINPTDSLLHAGSGLFLPTISGHQDGCATDCPGSNMYPLLPMLRLQLDSIISTCGSPASVAPQKPEWASFLQISPNPTTDFCQIKGFTNEKHLINFKLTDATGHQIMTKNKVAIKGDFVVSFDFAGIIAGKYLLVLKDELGNQTALSLIIQ
jgi:hypothetical protein